MLPRRLGRSESRSQHEARLPPTRTTGTPGYQGPGGAQFFFKVLTVTLDRNLDVTNSEWTCTLATVSYPASNLSELGPLSVHTTHPVSGASHELEIPLNTVTVPRCQCRWPVSYASNFVAELTISLVIASTQSAWHRPNAGLFEFRVDRHSHSIEMRPAPSCHPLRPA